MKEFREVFFKTFFLDSPEGMTILDSGGKLVSANKSFLSMLGYGAGDIEGRDFREILLEKDRNSFSDFLENVSENETVKNMKFYLSTVYKSIVRLFISATCLRTPSGEVGGYHLSFSHIHPDDWSSLNDPYLFQSVVKKLGRLTSVGQMTSVFAHDIKNPLHVILSTSELLETQNRDENAKPALELISRNARRASRIVKTLLDFSRSGMCQLIPFSVNDIAEYVVGLFESSLKNSRVVIRKNLKDVPKVFLDANYMNSVLYNLISNAIDAVGEEGEIRVSSGFGDGRVFLKVTDNGRGMDRNILRNLFHPFFTTKDKGTGLGLYLARQIMHEHNGEINVDSRPGAGTEVILSFREIA